MYSQVMLTSCKPIAIQTSWKNLFSSISAEIAWTTIWKNIKQASKNPNHQTLHLRFVHRTYLTFIIRHRSKLAPSPHCQLCLQGYTGTFIHVLGMPGGTVLLVTSHQIFIRNS